MSTGLEKISGEQVQAILEDAVTMLPKLAQDRDHYKELYEAEVSKTAAYAQHSAIDKLATSMLEKGLDSGKSHAELVESLGIYAQQNKLAEVQRAVELAGPDMGQKIAQVYDGGTGGDTDLSRYLSPTGAGNDAGGGSGGGGSASDFLRVLLDQ